MVSQTLFPAANPDVEHIGRSVVRRSQNLPLQSSGSSKDIPCTSTYQKCWCTGNKGPYTLYFYQSEVLVYR